MLFSFHSDDFTWILSCQRNRTSSELISSLYQEFPSRNFHPGISIQEPIRPRKMTRNLLIWHFILLGFLSTTLAQLLPSPAKNFGQNSLVNSSSLPLEIEVLLLRFSNPHGIVYNGKKCDFFAWGCDIKASAYIDVDKPYDEWPGQRDIQPSDAFFYRGEDSSPRFNQLFRKTICDPKSFEAGNLRVNLIDVDGGLRGDDDFINNFNCVFTKNSQIPNNPGSAGWSKEMQCDALYSNPLMAMYFQYRIYRGSSRAKCP